MFSGKVLLEKIEQIRFERVELIWISESVYGMLSKLCSRFGNPEY